MINIYNRKLILLNFYSINDSGIIVFIRRTLARYLVPCGCTLRSL